VAVATVASVGICQAAKFVCVIKRGLDYIIVAKKVIELLVDAPVCVHTISKVVLFTLPITQCVHNELVTYAAQEAEIAVLVPSPVHLYRQYCVRLGIEQVQNDRPYVAH
jgi:hypothetical protein